MEIIERRCPQEFEHPVEILVRLPGKTDDDVRPQGGGGGFLPQPDKDPGILGRLRPPSHELQEPVRAVLEGQVKVGAGFRARGDQFDERVVDKTGVERAQPDPTQALQTNEGPQQLEQGAWRTKVEPVGVEMDAAEDDLPEPAADEGPGPGEDVCAGQAAARPPHVWDDAEGAAQVTTVLDLEQGAGPQR